MKISAVNRRLLLPLLLSATVFVALTGLVDCLLLRWQVQSFAPLWMVPLLLVLADEAFVTGRTGLLIHHHARHTQAGLREFLVGNGAKQFEALLPYYRHVIRRTLGLSLWRWVLSAVVLLPALLLVALLGGLSLGSALGLYLLLLLSVVACSVLTLLFSAFLYDRLNR